MVKTFCERSFVSIQLVSPASGDCDRSHSGWFGIGGVSIQLVSPASGDGLVPVVDEEVDPQDEEFPFN